MSGDTMLVMAPILPLSLFAAHVWYRVYKHDARQYSRVSERPMKPLPPPAPPRPYQQGAPKPIKLYSAPSATVCAYCGRRRAPNFERCVGCGSDKIVEKHSANVYDAVKPVFPPNRSIYAVPVPPFTETLA